MENYAPPRWGRRAVLAIAAVAVVGLSIARPWSGKRSASLKPTGKSGGSFAGGPSSEGRSAKSLVELGLTVLREGNAREAEKAFRQAVEADPESFLARRELARLLNMLGRRREAAPHLFALVKSNKHTRDELGQLGDLSVDILFEQQIEQLLKDRPTDAAPLLAKARVAVQHNELARAREWLAKVTAAEPQLTEAQAWLGQALAALGDADAFMDWHASLPAGAEEHPDIWLVRGEWAERQQNPQGAARCYWEAVRRDPNHRQANHRLGQTLTALNDSSRAEPFTSRASLLQQLFTALLEEHSHADPIRPLKQAAELCEALGRPWEAWAWSQEALRVDPALEWAVERCDRLRAMLDRETQPQTLAASNPAWQHDLSSFPLPKWSLPPAPVPSTADLVSADVSFRDDAAAAGIDFRHYNSPVPETSGARLLETLGGGIVAFDYDNDGWCDLYFTQGCVWPQVPGQRQYLDRLYRNLGDGTFSDVTEQAGLGDERFSFGASAGDFDNDGFVDLYLGNVDLNRLYRNNGDGTFTDVGPTAGITAESWTSSCLIADLNGDGLPDLFDSTYATGKDVHTYLCDRGGRTGTCAPTTFEALRDRLFLNLGDGTFREVGVEAGLDVPMGYGLGLVAGDFNGVGRLSLFVANDSVPNFYFDNVTPQPGGVPKFLEIANRVGLALDADGKAQACMGIAADDANGDGKPDLLVTNLYEEPNAFYVQNSRFFSFEDRSRRAGIYGPSFGVLGFGAQFIDGELDGDPDLVVVNGHVDDYTWKGLPWKMRPQYFENMGKGAFRESAGKKVGPYFQGEYLGRPLARLDWNNDGLEDSVVTHLDVPAALLTNVTHNVGHGITVALRGVHGARDAIGAVVEVAHAGGVRTRHLFGGDGFQVANQRRLVFGLGSSDRVQSITVRWLGGEVQTWHNLPVDVDVLLIEGRAEAIVTPRSGQPAGRGEPPAAGP